VSIEDAARTFARTMTWDETLAMPGGAVIPPRLRAGLVIGAVVIASGIAGAAIDRALIMRTSQAREGDGRPPRAWGGSGRPHRDARPDGDGPLAHAAQRAGPRLDLPRTDSSLRAIRRETQPRIQQVFEQSKADVNARLDPAQREKFAKMRPAGPPAARGLPRRWAGAGCAATPPVSSRPAARFRAGRPRPRSRRERA
jgi:hypothetical protein